MTSILVSASIQGHKKLNSNLAYLVFSVFSLDITACRCEGRILLLSVSLGKKLATNH